MNGFREPFKEFYVPSERARKDALLKGLVCLDTNVLLDAYRFAPGPRDELLTALEAFGDRLWIPHQVALEFHRNRIKVISKQGQAYKDLLDTLGGLRDSVNSEALSRVRTLNKTIASAEANPETMLTPIFRALDRVIEKLEALRSSHGVTLDQLDSDPVLDAFENIFNGRVGEGFTPEEEDEAYKEAERRVKQKIPPGYKDASDKEDPAGDYLLWRQLLTEAKGRKLPLLFVTRDVKDDWFRREAGRTLSARPELIREARQVANVDFVIMETKSFLFHVRRYMTNKVSSNLISQVEDLPPIRAPKSKSGHYELAVVRALVRAGFGVHETAGPGRYIASTPDGVCHLSIKHFSSSSVDINRRIREVRYDFFRSSLKKMLLVTNQLIPGSVISAAERSGFSIATWAGQGDDELLREAVLQNVVDDPEMDVF